MRKPTYSLTDRHAGPTRAAKRPIVPLLILLLVVPFVYDGVKLYHSRFSAISGAVPIVHTPAFDLAELYYEQTTDALRRLAKHPFRRLPWSPQWAVGALVLSLAAGSLIIRFNRLK